MNRKDHPIWFKGQETPDWVSRFTVGEDYRWDTLLLPFDIMATRAHVQGLEAAGVLERVEIKKIDECLSRLSEMAASGDISVAPEDEDSHTVIERFLTKELGDAGRKIHTGRSRNDQVLAALRLFLRSHLKRAASRLAAVVEGLCAMAEKHQGDWMPGYTHMQRAMPTTAALWAAGYAELLVEDLELLADVHDRLGVSPLGSAAGYGVPLIKLPRQEVARHLGFRGIQINATSVQLSRGKYEMQVVHACVQIAATLNRLSSDLVLFNSSEFGFVMLPDEFCTGSSIMPQKKNPDVLELARATYHRLVAEMHLLATLPANLTSGYHRDLQLTKEAAMRAVTLTVDVLEAVESVLSGVQFDLERMRSALSPELLATAEALKRVLRGVPFRDAYRQAAESPSTQKLSAKDLAAMYTGDGYPGHASVDPIRDRLRSLTDFVD